VRGVPACYVINTGGEIVQAGHPAGLHAPEVVNRLLNPNSTFSRPYQRHLSSSVVKMMPDVLPG